MRFDPARELRLLGAAAQFLTRLPVPNVRFEPDWLPRSAKYFPLVGIAVGLLAAAVLVGASRLWPGPIPALLAVGAALFLTGALHEDGLADTADSLGGRTREVRLAIMKDPRIGVFGVLALGLCLGLRVAALAAMPLEVAAAALVAAAAGGRLMAVLLMRQWPYGGDPAASRGACAPDRPRGGEVVVALLIATAPVLLVSPERALLAITLGHAAAWIIATTTCRALGGYTGDVLGAAIAVYETAFLLGAVPILSLRAS